MARPYQRAVYIGIMRTLAVNSRIGVKSLDITSFGEPPSSPGGGSSSSNVAHHRGNGGGGSTEAYTINREVFAKAGISEADRAELLQLDMLNTINTMSFEFIHDIAKVRRVYNSFILFYLLQFHP